MIQQASESAATDRVPFVPVRGSACLSRDIADYPGGIIIPVDKPYAWTSADVIRKVKYAAVRHFGKKNLKVGHAGTLDPLATGILLVCIGPATKLAETLQSHDKEYVAGITFGATTPSYDLEKEIDRFFPYTHITEEALRAVLPTFLGEQDQVAPLFSAKSVDGVRAYEIARKLFKQKQINGAENADASNAFDATADAIIRTAKIRIDEIELLSFVAPSGTNPDTVEALRTNSDTVEVLRTNSAAPADPLRTNSAEVSDSRKGRINVTDNSAHNLPEARIRIACSKGTYIRALARDLGEALSSGAHLKSLVRTRSGQFTLDKSLSLDETLSLL